MLRIRKEISFVISKKKGIVKKSISVFLISYDNGNAIDLQNVHFQI